MLDPEVCTWAAVFGGGASPEIVREQLTRLRERLGTLAGRRAERRQRLAAADVRFRQAFGRVFRRLRPPWKWCIESRLDPRSDAGAFPLCVRGRAAARPQARLWAKLECFLPGAMKDRVALYMIEQAERREYSNREA